MTLPSPNLLELLQAPGLISTGERKFSWAQLAYFVRDLQMWLGWWRKKSGMRGENLGENERLEEPDKWNTVNNPLCLIIFLRRQRGRKGRREGKGQKEGR